MPVTALRRGLAAACCLLVCALMPSSASASARHDRLEARIVNAMNSVRASYGLPALRRPTASRARRTPIPPPCCAARSCRTGPSAAGPPYVRVRRVGENLAWMSRCGANAIVQMWLNSPSHRHVMLSRSFARVGVAKRSSSRVCFVTADFGTAR